MRVNKLLINLSGYCILIGVCLWFILVLAWNINSPVKDASEVNPAIQIQRFLNNKSPFKPFEITVYNKHFPIMSDIKHGATEVYLLMPFMLLDINPIDALRLGYIFLMLLAIISTYYFCSKLFDTAIANLTLLFLAMNVSAFIYFSQGASFGLTTPFFTVTSLIFMFKWHEKRRNIYLYIGLILLSFGFQTKGWFIWFIIALFITSLLFYAPVRRIRLKTSILCIVIFAVSLFPLLYYYRLANFNNFIMSNAMVSYSGISNTNILNNFILRLSQFNYLMGGAYDFGKISRVFLVSIFWISFVHLSLKVFGNKALSFSRNRVGFILLLFILTLLMSCFTFTDYKEGHLLLLFPFAQLIMSIEIIDLWRSKENIYKLIILIIISLFLLVNLFRYTSFYILSKIEREKYSCCSEAILAKWLVENKIDKVRIFDWDVACITEFFGAAKIDANVFRDIPQTVDPDFAMVKYAKTKDVFVFSFPRDRENLENFKSLVFKLHRKISLLKEFYCCDGLRRFAVYTLE